MNANGFDVIDLENRPETNGHEEHSCNGYLKTCCLHKSGRPRIPDVRIADSCGFRNIEGVGFRITGDNDNEAQFGKSSYH